MMKNLTPRDRLFLFYGGIISAAIIIYTLVLDPAWNSYQKMNMEIPRVALIKNRFQAIMEGAEKQGKKRDFLNKEFQRLLAACFVGNTEAIASGQLADTMRSMAASAGLALKSSKVEKAEKMGVFQKINLEVTFDASLAQIASYMDKIQNSTKRILIRDSRLATHREEYDNYQQELLSVKLLVSGLRYVQ